MKAAHNVPVLMYHHVSPSSGMVTTSPENFEQQIAGLARAGYRSLTTDQFGAHLAGRPVAEKSILITFDDGYLDNYVYAHPVLERYGMSAVLFLVTGVVHDGPARAQAGHGQTVPATPDHATCKARVLAGRADEVMVRWSEVQAMQRAGTFEFHSHTHTHTRWDEVCQSDTAAKRAHMAEELDASRQTLIHQLGQASDHLCWPQGYFDADYLEVGHAAGFRHFYTTDAFGQNTAGADPDHIYRFAVRNRGGLWINRRVWLARTPILGPRYNAWKKWKKQLRTGA